VLNGPDYFPSTPQEGPYLAQAFKSSPEFGENNVELLYLLGIASAKQSIKLETAYFVPESQIRAALIAASQRGVKVEILVPGKHTDKPSVRGASKSHWRELLAAGIKIYEYEPTMLHVKLMVIDGVFTSVGSANCDDRSTRLNEEANLNVLSYSFAREQTHLFEADKKRAKVISLNAEKKEKCNALSNQAYGLASPEL